MAIDWMQYLNNNPDVRAAANADKTTNAEAFAQHHYNLFGADEIATGGRGALGTQTVYDNDDPYSMYRNDGAGNVVRNENYTGVTGDEYQAALQAAAQAGAAAINPNTTLYTINQLQGNAVDNNLTTPDGQVVGSQGGGGAYGGANEIVAATADPRGTGVTDTGDEYIITETVENMGGGTNTWGDNHGALPSGTVNTPATGTSSAPDITPMEQMMWDIVAADQYASKAQDQGVSIYGSDGLGEFDFGIPRRYGHTQLHDYNEGPRAGVGGISGGGTGVDDGTGMGEEFDAQAYMDQNPDLAAAFERSGAQSLRPWMLDHYNAYGRFEIALGDRSSVGAGESDAVANDDGTVTVGGVTYENIDDNGIGRWVPVAE